VGQDSSPARVLQNPLPACARHLPLIGGGLVIVPALLCFMKLGEVDSIGTSLAALIPPVGLLGAMEYHRNGHVNLKYAMVIAAGLLVGSYFGARIILALPLTSK
jgi:uncharacterized protein